LILFSSALELALKIIMNILIIDAAKNKVFLTLMVDRIIYTCSHENSKINFEKLIILINDFLKKNNNSLDKIRTIYVNGGPGSFAGIRNSISTVKAIFLTKKIDYYCFSVKDFTESKDVEYQDVPSLCEKYKVKKNLINPIYLE
jgi:tRNA threonylcarbamoyladenosine biosynthesis protein TsaB